MRANPDEIKFSKFLVAVGNGELNDKNNNTHISKFPKKYLATIDSKDIEKDMYEDLFKNKEYRKAYNRAILATTNAQVDDSNKQVLELLDKETEKVYSIIDSAENCNDNYFNHLLTTKYLNSLKPYSLPSHELKLRKYSIIMSIRNLNVSEGLYKGTRLLVLDLGTNILKGETLKWRQKR